MKNSLFVSNQYSSLWSTAKKVRQSVKMSCVVIAMQRYPTQIGIRLLGNGRLSNFLTMARCATRYPEMRTANSPLSFDILLLRIELSSRSFDEVGCLENWNVGDASDYRFCKPLEQHKVNV